MGIRWLGDSACVRVHRLPSSQEAPSCQFGFDAGALLHSASAGVWLHPRGLSSLAGSVGLVLVLVVGALSDGSLREVTASSSAPAAGALDRAPWRGAAAALVVVGIGLVRPAFGVSLLDALV